ncbi:hypothetical protein [Cerasicoccus maritimus]|uniref:hypothetical protein n=1 Tax=Cerasicoccus maritimus TaxID=490089 RepID=UPI0028527A74|nr:hypothetical protein [Cerasicoccus maritimus]
MMKNMMLLAALCGLLFSGLVSTALADDGINPNTVTNQKLQTIRIPQLKFKDAPLSQVLDYIQQESFKEDPGPVVTGIEFIYMPPKGEEPTVKLSLRNIKVGMALEIICQKTGMQWDFDKGLIVVKKAQNPSGESASSQPMKTEIFDFNRDMVNRAKYSQQK